MTNYDPFGYDRVVYTIKNTCIEEPELCYNDGVNILYFNTSGTIGGSKDLRDLLKYIENSKKENVVNETTEELNNFVREIKRKGEGEYMTLGDWVDDIVAEVTADLEKTIADNNQALAAKDQALAIKDQALADKDQTIAAKDQALAAKDQALANRDARIKELEMLLASK